MAVDAGFRLVSTMTPSVPDEISMQPSLINTGDDNVAAIIGSDISMAAWAVTCRQLRFSWSQSAGWEEGV